MDSVRISIPNKDFSTNLTIWIIFPLVFFRNFKQMYHLSNAECFISMSHTRLTLCIFRLECCRACITHSHSIVCQNCFDFSCLFRHIHLKMIPYVSRIFTLNTIAMHFSIPPSHGMAWQTEAQMCVPQQYNDMHFCRQLKWTVIIVLWCDAAAMACLTVVMLLLI